MYCYFCITFYHLGCLFFYSFIYYRSRYNTRLIYLINGCQKQKCYKIHLIMWESDVLEQNRHYVWKQQPQICKKHVLDFIQQIWCKAVLLLHQRVAITADLGRLVYSSFNYNTCFMCSPRCSFSYLRRCIFTTEKNNKTMLLNQFKTFTTVSNSLQIS